MTLSLNAVVLFILLGNTNEAARILAVFPFPSISHQIVFRPLTQELAKRGHQIVVITTDPVFKNRKAPANLTEIDVHDISYNIWRENFKAISKGSKDDMKTQLRVIFRSMLTLVETQLKDKQVQKILHDKNQKFDLILAESCIRVALVYSHIYKVPVIQISSFGGVLDNYATIGAPIHPILYPAVTRQRINNLTLWEKITEVYNDYMNKKIHEDSKRFENDMIKKHFGKNAPTVDELNNNVQMLLLNMHPIFEGIRPVPPTVIYMGGLLQKPNKDLPLDLKSYLDSSKNGIIYLSFGTNVDPSLLPRETIQTLINAFSKLPYDVLWKWDKDELPGRSSNIQISKWLPQSDLLKHPKVKLFVMQGGLQSTDEAITAGVPLIGIPMLADQWFNAEKFEYHKIGVRLDMETLTEEKLIKTINTVISDNSYRQNMIKLRNYMQDEPMRPLDRAVWWIEYVLRYGGARHLRSPAANISWAEYLELEVVLTVLVILFVLAALTILVLRFIYNFVVKNCIAVKIKKA